MMNKENNETFKIFRPTYKFKDNNSNVVFKYTKKFLANLEGGKKTMSHGSKSM
jgi:hypothetical protein